jgi:hypothetical protein
MLLALGLSAAEADQVLADGIERRAFDRDPADPTALRAVA